MKIEDRGKTLGSYLRVVLGLTAANKEWGLEGFLELKPGEG